MCDMRVRRLRYYACTLHRGVSAGGACRDIYQFLDMRSRRRRARPVWSLELGLSVCCSYFVFVRAVHLHQSHIQIFVAFMALLCLAGQRRAIIGTSVIIAVS